MEVSPVPSLPGECPLTPPSLHLSRLDLSSAPSGHSSPFHLTTRVQACQPEQSPSCSRTTGLSISCPTTHPHPFVPQQAFCTE